MYFKNNQGSVLLITLVLLTLLYMSFFSLIFIHEQLDVQSQLLSDQLELERIVNILKHDLKNKEMTTNQCVEFNYEFAQTETCLAKTYDENNVLLMTSVVNLKHNKNYRVNFYVLND